MGVLEVAETVKIFKCGKRAANVLLGCVDDSLELFPPSHCTAGVPHTDPPAKGHQQPLFDFISPKHHQEVLSLLGHFQHLRGVHGPGQVFLDSKEEEVRHPAEDRSLMT
ncbi:hypothetical protein XENORESO_010703 [Xenotaenia resolanae]|uniref:Uncharacterized protein n=1 Tax=Xenotaenia resolanae TaxID=208358 RepID=A0ABV0W9P4_9TELE